MPSYSPTLFTVILEALKQALDKALEKVITPVILDKAIEHVIRHVDKALAPIRTALRHVLEGLLDPWEQIHSEITENFDAESSHHINDVSNFYGTPKQHYCMMLGKATHFPIICAHIWPKCTNGKGLEAVGLQSTDINNPRNFLRLHKSIKDAFDKKRLCFSFVMEGEAIRFVVNILDPSLLNETFQASENEICFQSLQDKAFDHKFVPPCKPFLRLIAIHATKALEKAQCLGWVDAGDLPARRQRALELARLALDPVLLNF